MITFQSQQEYYSAHIRFVGAAQAIAALVPSVMKAEDAIERIQELSATFENDLAAIRAKEKEPVHAI